MKVIFILLVIQYFTLLLSMGGFPLRINTKKEFKFQLIPFMMYFVLIKNTYDILINGYRNLK